MRGGDPPRPATLFGEHVVDLHRAVETALLDEPSLHRATSLDAFAARGLSVWRAVRARLRHLLSTAATEAERRAIERCYVPRGEAVMQLPVHVGDYVDFYSSIEHATNLGRILRPGGEALLPNYRFVPLGYHGRAGTIVPSGTTIRRPAGQRKAVGEQPTFGRSEQLDVEVELGWIAGPGNALGEPIPGDAVREHVLGFVLLNDWSARDIQAWEYQPLGPFLGKSFATSISPWIVTLDALEPFRVAEPPRDPKPLPYLRTREAWSYDIELELLLQTPRMRQHHEPPLTISRTNARSLYWTVAQQLAHVTSNGATIRPGDLFGTGTISGFEARTQGSLIELTWRGERPIALPGGETRSFLEDGDAVIIRGHAVRGHARVGFGEVVGMVAEGEDR